MVHVARPSQSPRIPLHVTIRLVGGIPRLRQRRGYRLAQRAMALANRFEGARLCHLSIQHNHLHFIIEADDRRALTRAMQSFAISFAKNVNTQLAGTAETPRRGAVVADRYHLEKLRTPAQVRAALAYVLGNWRRHGEDRRVPGPPRRADRYSSGPFFTGWDVPPPPIIPIAKLPFPADGALPIRFPISWLLRDGWKRHGPLSPWQRPGPSN